MQSPLGRHNVGPVIFESESFRVRKGEVAEEDRVVREGGVEDKQPVNFRSDVKGTAVDGKIPEIPGMVKCPWYVGMQGITDVDDLQALERTGDKKMISGTNHILDKPGEREGCDNIR